MPPRNRTLALAAFPVVALFAYLWLGRVAAGLLAPLAGAVDGPRDWLAITIALYVINYVIAWVYRSSWAVTLGRSLAWAFFAYLQISNLVDLFAEHREAAWQILGSNGPLSGDELASLRARTLCYALCLIAAVVCIAVGFERRGGEDAGASGEGS